MKWFFAIAAITGLAACAEAPSELEAPADRADQDPQSETSANVAESAPELAPEPLVHAISAQCMANEPPIFSCKVESGKQLSVCGKEGGGAQYRFGPQEAAELVLNGGVWANVAYSGGGEAQLKFDSGDTSYVVFSRIVRTNFAPGEPNNPQITDGVTVLKDGEPIARQMCDDPDVIPVNYEKADELLLREDELFTELG